ncbi:MAG: hypothetical protein MJ193_00800 [Clostridia bacterium]|nr:hypothetical protein [Clostridia bacterium]
MPKEHESLPITDEMIRKQMQYNKMEFDESMSYDEAKAELEKLRDKGCLLYDDCRSCPLFGHKCPL